MKNADFSNTGLGVTENTFDFLQNQNKELRDLVFQFLSLPTSGNVIITGIEEGTPDSYSKGWMAVDGELIEVPAGIGTKIEVIENITAVAYDDNTNKDTYYHKYGDINGATGIDISTINRHSHFKTATDLLQGVLRVATTAEAKAGTLNNVAITPSNLQHAIRKMASAFHSTLHTDLEGLTDNDPKFWYWKSQTGSVHFTGDKINCKTGVAANTTIFTLNSQCRPSSSPPSATFDNLTFLCPVDSTTISYTNLKLARIEIKTNGEVRLLDALLVNDFVDIRGISFVTDN